MYPRVKVREQEEDVSSEDDSSSFLWIEVFQSFSIHYRSSPSPGNAKLNSKPSSVLRPRAVLSSPDNDGMIGNMNKSIKKTRSTQDKCSTKISPNQAKVKPAGHVQAETSRRLKIGSKEGSNNKTSLKQGKPIQPINSRQKDTCHKKETDCSIRIQTCGKR